MNNTRERNQAALRRSASRASKVFTGWKLNYYKLRAITKQICMLHGHFGDFPQHFPEPQRSSVMRLYQAGYYTMYKFVMPLFFKPGGMGCTVSHLIPDVMQEFFLWTVNPYHRFYLKINDLIKTGVSDQQTHNEVIAFIRSQVAATVTYVCGRWWASVLVDGTKSDFVYEQSLYKTVDLEHVAETRAAREAVVDAITNASCDFTWRLSRRRLDYLIKMYLLEYITGESNEWSSKRVSTFEREYTVYVIRKAAGNIGLSIQDIADLDSKTDSRVYPSFVYLLGKALGVDLGEDTDYVPAVYNLSPIRENTVRDIYKAIGNARPAEVH